MTSQKILTLRKESYQEKLPAYAWPGGYPLFYLDSENAVLCPICAELFCKEDGQWSTDVIDYDVHWEGEDMQCEHCYKAIESAYGPVESD